VRDILVIKLILIFLSWLAALMVVISACRPAATATSLGENERLALVKEIKAFQQKLGFNPTENFASISESKEAYDYYFYAPVADLPYSLDDPALKFGEGKRENSSLDTRKYDVFYYSIPALAGISTPITKSLLESPLHRFIFIIFHEDWHEQIKSPLGIEESSGELMGYVPAMLFTEARFGRNSDVYQTLDRELTNKLKEARLFQSYYEELTTLYNDYRAGKISEAETLGRKLQLINALDDDIYGVWGRRRDQLNNAFIAFQMTYFRHLNLMHDVYTASNSDVLETIKVLRGIPEQSGSFDNNIERTKGIEARIAEYLRSKT